MPGFARIHEDSLRIAVIREDSLGFSRTSWDMPGFAGMRQDSQGFARIRGWVREDSRMDSQGFADGFAWIRESSQWIRTDSRKFTMDSHGFAKVCKYTPIRTDSRKSTKVRNRFTSIRGWIRKDSRKFTYGFAPIHKDSHPIIQSNHGGIREWVQLRQYSACG